MDTTHHLNQREIKVAIDEYVRGRLDIGPDKLLSISLTVDPNDKAEAEAMADVKVTDREGRA